MQFYSFINGNVLPHLPQKIEFIKQQHFDLGVIGYKFYQRLLNLYKIYFSLRKECLKLKCHHTPNKLTLSLLSLNQVYMNFIKKVEFIEDYTWEKLNTGNWRDIHTSWRLLYAHTFLLKIMINTLIIMPIGTIIPMLNFNNLVDYLPPIIGLSPEELDNFKICHQLLIWCDKSILMGIPIIITDQNIFTRLGDILCSYITSSDHYLTCILGDFDTTPSSTTAENVINNVKKQIMFPMEVRDEPTLEEFQNEVMKRGEPVVLTNIITDWPCFETQNHEWSLAYLLKHCGPRLVPVEIGKRYTDSDWYQELMPFWKFVKNYFLAPTGPTKGYLAQHLLFDQIPKLKEDFTIPLYCACSTSPDAIEDFENDVEINCWFGPGGTVSPLHYDPKPNLLCQVFGYKYVRMYHPSQSHQLYAYTEHEQQLGTNTSPVDVENVDLTKYPDFGLAKFVECLLQPGQVLYIPPGYWHFVKSLAPSFSVNFWWQ